MKTRWRISSLALLAVGIAVIVWTSLPPREPVYEGKPARFWLDQSLTNMVDLKADVAAFKAMGSAAVPFLIRSLKGERSWLPRTLHDKLVSWARRRVEENDFRQNSPNKSSGWLERWVEADSLRGQRRIDAAFLLGELGPAAAPAVPTLMSIYRNPAEDWRLR